MNKTILSLCLIIIVIVGGAYLVNKTPVSTSDDKSLPPPVVVVPMVNTVDESSKDISRPTDNVAPTKEFTVSGANFSFTPSALAVNKGDRVKITFKNVEGFHDLRINEFGVATQKIRGEAEEVVEFTADKIGDFEYYCSVGSHRAMGMKGTLSVR